MDSAVSEYAILIADLIADALAFFGSVEDVQTWLHSPLIGLCNEPPVSLLDTGFGIRLIREKLGRL